jgi:molybdopterin-binding protein
MAHAYRIGEVATLLGVSADAVRKLVDDGSLKATRTPGGQREIDGAGLAKFLQAQIEATDPVLVGQLSARNQFRGIVTRVIKDKVTAQVDLVSGSHRLVSLMTREAADELGLEPGVIAIAAVKAPAVFIERLAPDQ